MKLHAAAPTFLLFLGRFSSSKSHDLSVVAEDRPTCNRCRLTATVPSLEREKTIQLEIIRNRVISKARSKVVNFCPTETEKASIIIGDGAVSCLFMPNAMMIHKNLVIKKTPLVLITYSVIRTNSIDYERISKFEHQSPKLLS